MSTPNIGFYEKLTKLSLNYHQISSNTHLISSARIGRTNVLYAVSFTSWGQEYKFLLKNPRVLLALVQILIIWVVHFKSFVIVTPR